MGVSDSILDCYLCSRMCSQMKKTQFYSTGIKEEKSHAFHKSVNGQLH